MTLMHFNNKTEVTGDVVDAPVCYAELDETGLVTVYCNPDTDGSQWYFTLSQEEMKIIQNPERV